ncbi:hypothetical protein [Paucibacter sp. B51]|uniref:hypothetical protein n=1 Tax=Paucibacter sp. B51 TaxID=2993315 RepID=UPI0022EBC89E|nr:hypothetical protein [Paucibacter sp. B51]
MQGLASFDRWLTRRAAGHLSAVRTTQPSLRHLVPVTSPAPQPATLSFTAQPAPAAQQHLLGPTGEHLATLPRGASAAQVLRAALGLKAGDWIGVLADEGRSRGLQQAWRLALLRQQGAALQWLSEPLWARPGQRPAQLQQAAQRLALQALWQQGFRLRDATFALDLH